MLKRLLACVVALGVMASVATADVVFQWEPTELKAGENTTLTLFANTNPGLDLGIGSLVFFFSDSDEAIRLKEFRWIDELKVENIYVWAEDLPDDVWTIFILGTCEFPLEWCVRYPPDGSKLKIAELDVQVDELGSFILDMGTGRAEATQAEGQQPLEIKGGLATKLTVVPEPASLGLLLLGTLAMARRRR